MSTINGRACVANGRNLYLNSKAIKDGYHSSNGVNVTVEPFDSTTNMWHFVASQGSGDSSIVGIYLWKYANGKIPDNSDWSYSVDVKGTGKIYKLGVESGNHNPVAGTVGSEWSRISQTGRTDNDTNKSLVMYFYTTNSPLDVYIKLPKLEIGTTSTPLTPAPVDKVFSNGKQVYGRNLLLDSQTRTRDPYWFSKNLEWTNDWGTYLGSNIKRTAAWWDNDRYSYKDLLDKGVINTTDDFTYSIYFRVVGEDPAGMSYSNINFFSSVTDKNSTVVLQLTSLKESQWTRIVVHFKFNGAKYDPAYINSYGQSIRVEASAAPKVAGAHYEFAAPKLEKGLVATPYSIAPEDVM